VKSPFLLVGHCAAFDIPLKLCASADDAREFADRFGPAEIQEVAEGVMGVGTGSVLGVGIIGFDGGGNPVTYESVRNFTGDGESEASVEAMGG
jgi:hypothetical protein